ncbi:MAG: hypothetical protein EOM19_03945 [Candidatus Moranbacteria bacterium]|nr:hypothetical protein [Candidatus Moranbacteria bacterium]
MNAFITLNFPLHSFGTHHDALVKRKILALLRSYSIFVAKLSIENPELSTTKEIEKDHYEIGNGRIHARIIIFANGGKKKIYSCSIRGEDEQSKSLLQQAVHRYLQTRDSHAF